MNQYNVLITFVLTSLLAWGAAVNAQQSPHIGYVFPAGGRQGTEFEVRVGGQFLDGIAKAHISGLGIQVKVVELVKPMSQQQVNELRDKVKALTDRKAGGAAPLGKPADKSGNKPGDKPGDKPANKPIAPLAKTSPLSAEEEQLIVDIRKKLAKFYNRPPNPAIAETAVLRVTTLPDAAPGVRELRLETPAGLTNPLVFQIGRLPEVVKKPFDADDLPVQRPFRQLKAQSPIAKGEQPICDVQLPVVVNGQILPGQVDRYRFAAKKGQHLVIAVSAQQLLPYLADAVPGWFQATIRLSDQEGKEVAYAGSFRFHPDPVLHHEVLRDGNYALEIRDSVFRGREDFVYRMALGELPFVTGIFPLGGKAGDATHIAVQGWNLPFTSLTEDAKGKNVAIDYLDANHRSGPLNALPFALDSLPECVEQEPNDSPEHAQRVTLPVIINGRVDHPGDRDVFCFEGKAGQEIVAEVYARRLDSPLDSVLKLTDSAGRQLAFNDDHEDKAYGLLTHHADSWLRAVLPSAGTYYLHLYDAQNQGGSEYTYRLRIGQPQPDFELRIVPSSINTRAGTAVPITVHALRRDGFNGPIDLELKNAPAGFGLSGAKIPAGQAKVRLTLTVPPEPGQSATVLRMEGHATIAGGEVRRPVVPADDMMQAFYYHHLVPAQEWTVGIIGRGRGGIALKLRDLKEVKLPSGGTAELHFIGPRGPFFKTVQLTLSEPPDGLSIQKITPSENGIDIVLRADAVKLKPGWKGNAILVASVERVPDAKNAKVKPVKRRVSLGALPAVPVEIVGK
ncbi:MAG: hypothetical protein WCJ35_01790 [Planctomycetota bacterium]